MRRCLALALLLISVSARAQTTPSTWPVVYSETYRLEGGEVRQIPLTWEGIPVRRFYLRLHAAEYFEAVVTRVRDGHILFMGHFEPDYGVLIPWGRDEYAHLTLQTPWEGGLNVTLTLATDPEEEGLEVYSFHLNRFLEFYAQGNMPRAEQELSEALVEDPENELARLLQERFWAERGSAGDEVAAVPDSVSEDARTVVLVLAAEEQVDGGQYGEASSMLQSALPQLANEHNRFAVYRLLARINRDLGNDHQLELIIEKALGETQDEALRREAESWRD